MTATSNLSEQEKGKLLKAMIHVYTKEMSRLVVPLMPLEVRELELNHNFITHKSIAEVARTYSDGSIPSSFLSNVKVFKY